MDAFASALGFFLVGFDRLSGYKSPQCIHLRFFDISDPVLWFFKVNMLSAQNYYCNSCYSSLLLVMQRPFSVVV